MLKGFMALVEFIESDEKLDFNFTCTQASY